MADYEAIKLTKQDGTVVAYFAPAFKVTPVMKNELIKKVMPKNKGTKIRDINKWQWEVTVQGQFEHSDNLPQDHQNALESLFGSLPVSARQQVNRIRHLIQTTDEAMFLYENADEYTATSKSEIDIENGIFPTVVVEEFRPPRTGGHSRFQYTVKLVVGFDL